MNEKNSFHHQGADMWFSFMELEVAWTAEFKFFILFNEVLEAARNPFLGSSTLTFLTTSAYAIGLEQEPVLLNECWCVSLWYTEFALGDFDISTDSILLW